MSKTKKPATQPQMKVPSQQKKNKSCWNPNRQPLSPPLPQQSLCKPQWLRFSRLMQQKFVVSDKTETIVVHFTLEDFLKRLKTILVEKQCPLGEKAFRLVGSAASSILSFGSEETINDVDINVKIGNFSFFQILQCEEECLGQFIEEQTGHQLSPRDVCDSFFKEMIRVNTAEESWSLITIGHQQTNIDIRFIEKTKRSYAFSTDSFFVVLDPVITPGQSLSSVTSITFESDYGDLNEALQHLKQKQLKIKNPQEIRRGLFRLVLELAKGRRFVDEAEQEMVTSTFCQALFDEFQSPESFELTLGKFLSKHQAHVPQFLKHLLRIVQNYESQYDSPMKLSNCIISFTKQQHQFCSI